MAVTPQNPVLKEYLDIVVRRKWWIIVPSLVGILFSIALYFHFPKLYQAETRVKIRPQTISKALLKPIVEISSAELVTTITAEITSEKYVQELDDRLHLVGMPGGPQDLSELAKILEQSIDLNPNPKKNYFDLKVTWNDPRIAASIANELADIYIRRNEEIRRAMAEETLAKLRANREQIERRLHDIRSRIEKFRSEHKFELTSYQKTNEDQLQANRHEIQRIDDEIRDLEGRIREVELEMQVPPTEAQVQAVDPRIAELAQARRDLQALRRQGLKDAHPRVRALRARIAELERDLGLEAATSDGKDAETRVIDIRMAQLEQEKERLQREIAVRKARRRQLVEENLEIRARLERTPDNQIQLDKMLQIETRLAEDLADARRKERDAVEGAQVEEFKQGERFEILNYARPPKQPFWPDLKLFLFMGLAVGAGLGIGLVLLLEMFDQSFKTEEQLAASIDLPILAVIPDLTRAAEQKRPRRAGGRERKAG